MDVPYPASKDFVNKKKNQRLNGQNINFYIKTLKVKKKIRNMSIQDYYKGSSVYCFSVFSP